MNKKDMFTYAVYLVGLAILIMWAKSGDDRRSDAMDRIADSLERLCK
jgi:hypothetical protein